MINKKFLLVLVLLFSNLFAQEKIRLFDVIITIHKNGWMDVEEKITVNAKGIAIRRGIVREIPLRYRILGIFNYLPKFTLNKILHNDQPAAYHVETVYNGKHIFIGSKHAFIRPGTHTYTIDYSTNKNIGFFKDHDELYWNITGNQWRFPIEKIQTKVHLPEGVNFNDIQAIAYVGRFGSRAADYVKSIHNNIITFSSTRPLMPGEAFTIVVGWPKGIVFEPTKNQRIIDFFGDNGYLFIIFFGLLSLIILCFIQYFSNKVRPGIIIPRFKPPTDFTPSMCRYLLKRNCDSTCFAAEVVKLAVQGFLKINLDKKFIGFKLQYSLVMNGDKIPQEVLEKQIYSKLFVRAGQLELSNKNHKIIKSALDVVKNFVSNKLDQYFDAQWNYLLIGVGIGFATCLLASFFGAHSIEFGIVGVVFIGALIAFYFAIRGYTQEGQEIVDQIKGFQLFLRTAETERLKLMAPADKSPELYERFLPYAIALDAEREWTRSFAPIFKQFEVEGHPYRPVWFYGGRFESFSADTFSSSFSSFVSTLKTSSSPTRSSGFGSGGGAGRGGGGGGGGGW
ncbi:hypothetical protein A3F06_00970 [candidate division TM6 bacterium RIFCSPHIGHO2_12_FULL_36_22]|nr:MAG: hypothetical protein A3F06_00970 [candidate division TM6 bacterium RIFCSPHIGHO2_12_FULL_36_22]